MTLMKMLDKENHRMGITPILLRRAAFYLSLGIGEYTPSHPIYDKIRVLELYPMQPEPKNPENWSIGFRIDFCQNNRVLQFVEFSAKVTGAGGVSFLKEIK